MKDLTNVEIVGKEYRKKTTIEAVKINHPFRVKSREGWKTGKKGDWLAVGVEGERHIIDNGIFHKTYEPVEEPNEYILQGVNENG